jgi:TIR domain
VRDELDQTTMRRFAVSRQKFENARALPTGFAKVRLSIAIGHILVLIVKNRLFVSHISEERKTAELFKTALNRDFLRMVEVFVSSDTESIAAGEEWLRSIEKALRECSAFVILCSPESIRRPWINFEAGAAWMQNVPLIPVCHAGLLPRDLKIPLSLKHGVSLTDSNGLRRVYKRVAKIIECDMPERDFDALATEFKAIVPQDSSPPALEERDHNRYIQRKLAESLNNPRFKWRSLERVAAEAAITEEQTADLLRADKSVRFSKGKKLGKIIVGLRSRVG